MGQLAKDIEQNLSALIENAKVSVYSDGEKLYLILKISGVLSETISLPLADDQVRLLLFRGHDLSETRTIRFEKLLKKLQE